MKHVPVIATLATVLSLSVPAIAQDASAPAARPAVSATKIAQAPRIDGQVLDDPVWQALAPLTSFWQTAPDAGQPASERTEVRIAYTADTIYFGIVCFDADPSGLTISEARRDSSLDDTDAIRIILDTYRDGQNGFVFGTNPAGLEYDGQVSNEGQATTPNPSGGGGGGGAGAGRQQAGSGGGFNLNWDGSWQVRTSTTERGWSAEFAIPLRTLRYAPGSSQTWGLNLQRNIRRRKETAYWAPLPIQFDLYRVSQAGTLTGLTIATQRNLKVVPYALAETRRRAVDPDATVLGELGGDLKYSLTPGLTLDGTYNTDFAQVEVDEQQINLDRFNLFFPEKRPFFLENAGLFAVGSPGEAELFFSRRIGIDQNGLEIPIVAGARLSGRAGPVNVGLLNMQTESQGVRPGNNFTVARLRQDFRNRSNLGAIFVGRQATGDRAGADNHNRAFAVDGRLGIRRTGLITAFAARTMTPRATSGQYAYQIQARNETQPLTLSAGYTETGRNFNPEVGFLSRVGGFRKADAGLNARIRPNGRFGLQELRPHSAFRAFFNHDGFYETQYWHIDNHWELTQGHEIHTGMNLTREGVLRPFQIFHGVIVPPGTYSHQEAQFVFLTNDAAPLSGRIQVITGGAFGGDRVQWQPSLRVRSSELDASLNLTRNRYDIPGGTFTTNLARARVSYSFSSRVFVQGLLQYNDRDDIWSSNLRFGWLQQANTGVFLVYTDTHPFDDLDSVLPARPDRSFTIKISRMFDVLN